MIPVRTDTDAFLALTMPSLITATLSADDRADLRDTMRPPLVWLSVWTVRGLETWEMENAR